MDRKTIDHYLQILEKLFLVRIHGAWHTNLSHREIKSPKVYVTDTGLQTALIGADAPRIKRDGALMGAVLETFAAMELVRLAGWSDDPPRTFHYRDRDGREIDVLLERPDGAIIGVEVKAAATVSRNDFYALAYLRTKVGSRFLWGLVLYAGERWLPFGDRLAAVPLSSLWM
jgi:predicted AAA+ superfamily ATPase